MSNASNIEFSTELLRRLHRIHRQRTDLNSQIDRGPRQIAAGEKMVADASADVEAARDRAKHAKMVSDEKQMQLQEREDRIKDLESKLNTAASNREFSTLQEQIAADKQANSVLCDEILESMEQVDNFEAEVTAAKEVLATQTSEQEIRLKAVEEKMVTLRSELERIEAELVAAEAEIPTAARNDYKRVTDAKGEDALAPVEENSCGGCYQTLTTQHLSQLQMSILIRCPNCNAFLYLPENLRP